MPLLRNCRTSGRWNLPPGYHSKDCPEPKAEQWRGGNPVLLVRSSSSNQSCGLRNRGYLWLRDGPIGKNGGQKCDARIPRFGWVIAPKQRESAGDCHPLGATQRSLLRSSLSRRWEQIRVRVRVGWMNNEGSVRWVCEGTSSIVIHLSFRRPTSTPQCSARGAAKRR